MKVLNPTVGNSECVTTSDTTEAQTDKTGKRFAVAFMMMTKFSLLERISFGRGYFHTVRDVHKYLSVKYLGRVNRRHCLLSTVVCLDFVVRWELSSEKPKRYVS